jgi:hypothetical protein
MIIFFIEVKASTARTQSKLEADGDNHYYP